MIPYQNVQNLMLNQETREAIKEGLLQVFPIKHISEAFELATGVPLGIKDVFDEDFSKGSALETISKILDDLEVDHDDEPSDKKEPKHETARVASISASSDLASSGSDFSRNPGSTQSPKRPRSCRSTCTRIDRGTDSSSGV